MESIQDDDIALPPDTLAILNEFLKEKHERQLKEEEHILSKSGNSSAFEEDWQLSQFWYNERTKQILTKVVASLLRGKEDHIALLSCPSLYTSVAKIHPNVKIFEFDRRFAALGEDFVFYDLSESDNPEYLEEHAALYDIIIADPPFLSENCIKQMALTVNKLRKDNTKIILCSGEVVEQFLRNYMNLKRCKFRPEHDRNLGNEFISYANFDLDKIL